MALIQITGTIQSASGAGVEHVVVRLSPAPESVGAAEAIDGVGVLSDPVELTTDSSGDFSIAAIQGFRYSLEIGAIGFDRQFIAPSQSSIRFDLLGLVPIVEAAPQGVTKAGVRETHVVVRCDSVQSVRQRFDRVILQTSSALDGPYSDLITIELHSQKKFYAFTHSNADSGIFYRARYQSGSAGDVSSNSESIATADHEEDSLLVSVEELKQNYLFGVDLTKDDGEPFPQRMFKQYIAAGADWLAKELDISLVAQNFSDEVQDHYAKDWNRWGYFQLWNYPVIQIDRVTFQYPSMDSSVEIDSRWVELTEGGASGVVQVIPGQGSIADVLLIPGSIMPMWSGRSGRVPSIWHFDYRAGFEPNKAPADIKHVISMWASIGILNIAGDLISGAGVATKSVSIPGLSQTISTTSSATNSGYGARVIEYQKELKQMLPNLRRFFGKNTRMVVA